MRKQEAVPMATQDSPNLYERGGIYSIATVVDDLIDRVMTSTLPVRSERLALPFGTLAAIGSLWCSFPLVASNRRPCYCADEVTE
jgi:hypothetical protein